MEYKPPKVHLPVFELAQYRVSQPDIKARYAISEQIKVKSDLDPSNIRIPFLKLLTSAEKRPSSSNMLPGLWAEPADLVFHPYASSLAEVVNSAL